MNKDITKDPYYEKFKEMFNKHKELSKEMRGLKESLNILLKKKGE